MLGYTRDYHLARISFPAGIATKKNGRIFLDIFPKGNTQESILPHVAFKLYQIKAGGMLHSIQKELYCSDNT